MKRIATTLLLASLLGACATAPQPRTTTIARGDDERPPVAEVTPHRGSPKMRRAGYVLLAIGGVFAVGAAIAGATSNQPGCHDESCWLPQLTAGLTLGSLGGSFAITGGALAIAGRDR